MLYKIFKPANFIVKRLLSKTNQQINIKKPNVK